MFMAHQHILETFQVSGAENKRIKVILLLHPLLCIAPDNKNVDFWTMFIMYFCPVPLSDLEQSSNRNVQSGTRRIQSQICMTDVPETGARKMESIYGAGFWSVCHEHQEILYLALKITHKPWLFEPWWWQPQVIV